MATTNTRTATRPHRDDDPTSYHYKNPSDFLNYHPRPLTYDTSDNCHVADNDGSLITDIGRNLTTSKSAGSGSSSSWHLSPNSASLHHSNGLAGCSVDTSSTTSSCSSAQSSSSLTNPPHPHSTHLPNHHPTQDNTIWSGIGCNVSMTGCEAAARQNDQYLGHYSDETPPLNVPIKSEGLLLHSAHHKGDINHHIGIGDRVLISRSAEVYEATTPRGAVKKRRVETVEVTSYPSHAYNSNLLDESVGIGSDASTASSLMDPGHKLSFDRLSSFSEYAASGDEHQGFGGTFFDDAGQWSIPSFGSSLDCFASNGAGGGEEEESSSLDRSFFELDLKHQAFSDSFANQVAFGTTAPLLATDGGTAATADVIKTEDLILSTTTATACGGHLGLEEDQILADLAGAYTSAGKNLHRATSQEMESHGAGGGGGPPSTFPGSSSTCDTSSGPSSLSCPSPFPPLPHSTSSNELPVLTNENVNNNDSFLCSMTSQNSSPSHLHMDAMQHLSFPPEVHHSQRYLKKYEMGTADATCVQRPALSEQHVKELNDITHLRNDEKTRKLIVDYVEGMSFPLGEGGRELLRACLNAKGCKGRQLQGASVPALLTLAKEWGLWDVALRIKVERSTGNLCSFHEQFVRFKANQSQMRKNVKKEYMLTERGFDGKINKIVYDENRKITLGKEGREALRAQLRRLHDKHPGKMDELLSMHKFKYSELRNATVQQLSRMAFICNLWDQVVHACRKQEEKKLRGEVCLTKGENITQSQPPPMINFDQDNDKGSILAAAELEHHEAIINTNNFLLEGNPPTTGDRRGLLDNDDNNNNNTNNLTIWHHSQTDAVVEQLMRKHHDNNEHNNDAPFEEAMFQSFCGLIDGGNLSVVMENDHREPLTSTASSSSWPFQ